MRELNEKEQKLRDEEDEILMLEEGDMTSLIQLKNTKEEHARNATQMEVELDILAMEEKAIARDQHMIAARQEVLESQEESEENKLELINLAKEEEKNKTAFGETLAKIANMRNAIEKELKLKKELEAKERQIIETKVTSEGRDKLKAIALQLTENDQNRKDVKEIVSAARSTEDGLQRDLVETNTEEEKNLYKFLDAVAKKEFKRLKDLQMQKYKEVKKREKELAKTRKLQEKAERDREALKKKDEKILENKADKEVKEKLKKLKQEKKVREIVIAKHSIHYVNNNFLFTQAYIFFRVVKYFR